MLSEGSVNMSVRNFDRRRRSCPYLLSRVRLIMSKMLASTSWWVNSVSLKDGGEHRANVLFSISPATMGGGSVLIFYSLLSLISSGWSSIIALSRWVEVVALGKWGWDL